MSSGFYLLDHHVSRHTPRENGTGRPWYPERTGTIRVGVIHTAENLPDFTPPDMGAEAVARYGASTERASWHDTIDSDSWIRMLPHSSTAFHVVGYNSISVGVELATQAAKWVDTPIGWRLALLENCARWVADVHTRHHLPIRLLTKAEVDAGLAGFTFHSRLDPDRRSDPGDAFPWPHVAARATVMAGTPSPPTVVDRHEWAPWAAASIETMLELGVLRGDVTDGRLRFRPKDAVTREELAVALDRLRNLSEGS